MTTDEDIVDRLFALLGIDPGDVNERTKTAIRTDLEDNGDQDRPPVPAVEEI